jgi:hypothetical protein
MRIFVSFIAIFAIALTISVTALGAGHAAAGGMMQSKTGDLNADGTANSVDALLVLFYNAGLSSPPPDGADLWFAEADVNCDTTVNALDATLILQAGAGLYNLRP